MPPYHGILAACAAASSLRSCRPPPPRVAHRPRSRTAAPKIATIELFTRAAAAADPRLREAATRANALLSRWSDEHHPATFSADFRQEGLRLFLARTNPEGAACGLGDVDLVHADDATFRVRCGAHELRMTVGHLDDAGRIGRFLIRKAPHGRCGHAPRPAATKPL